MNLFFFLVIALAKVQLFLDIELENHIFDIKLLIFDFKLRRCIHNMLHVSLIIDHERRWFLDVESWIQNWFVLFDVFFNYLSSLFARLLKL